MDMDHSPDDSFLTLSLHPQKPKTIKERNSYVCKELVDFIKDLPAKKLRHVYPSTYLRDICECTGMKKFAASSLRLGKGEKEKRKAEPNSKQKKYKMDDKEEPEPEIVHFKWHYMDDPEWQSSLPEIKSCIEERLTACLSGESNVSIQTAVTQISWNIMKNLSRMVDEEVTNEAQLRFCISDPILCGICDTWGYRTKLEESVKDRTDEDGPSDHGPSEARPLLLATPKGLTFHKKVISDRSRANYKVYLITGPDNKIISIFIEAKHTSNPKLSHVIAHLIGYFTVFDNTLETPLVFFLTELYIEVVIFPLKKEVPIVNAVVLPRLNLFNEDGSINQFTLKFLLSYSKSYQEQKLVTLPKGIPHISRAQLQQLVQTETQQFQDKIAELEQHQRAMEERYQQLEKKCLTMEEQYKAQLEQKCREIQSLRSQASIAP